MRAAILLFASLAAALPLAAPEPEADPAPTPEPQIWSTSFRNPPRTTNPPTRTFTPSWTPDDTEYAYPTYTSTVIITASTHFKHNEGPTNQHAAQQQHTPDQHAPPAQEHASPFTEKYDPRPAQKQQH
ncbi:hypothetical protein EJ06DRAFT_551757 [Trichodelitschia bisporula]|uniref:Uncharacterized protein n=1 Tax=Trichodelitschia bisporula TaxID=703511 RepID=A0A6G1HKI1_9PEZI|nr:hypothetical protein EJ06DRAFT_551757 [Trichodelitschia bisporula]